MTDRVLILSLGGCAILGALLFVELAPGNDDQLPLARTPAQVTEAPAAQPQTPIDQLVAAALGSPLFSATRRPQQQAAAGQTASVGLANLRLTGIVIEPDRHFAIFAVTGAKPLVRAEGETVDQWRLDSITPTEVSLSGPAGITTLQPKSDPSIVRPKPGSQFGQSSPLGRPPVPSAPFRPPVGLGAQHPSGPPGAPGVPPTPPR